MSYTIITNNPKLAQQINTTYEHFNVLLLEGSVKDVIFTARDYLMKYWTLAADPLGGRLERANPYLTIIMNRKFDQQIRIDDIQRVEMLLSIFYKNTHFFEALTTAQKSGYQVLDQSLAEEAIQKMKCL